EAGKTSFEAVLTKRLGDPRVVDGSVRIDPVALWVDRQCQHLRQVGTLEQDLLSRHETTQQIQLRFVQLKQIGVVLPIKGRVGQQQLRRATFDHRSQEVDRVEVLDRLRGENHCCVAVPAGLRGV